MNNLIRLFQSGELAQQGFGRHYKPLEERFGQTQEEIPTLQGEIDFFKIQALSNDEVLEEAKDLYGRWPTLEQSEKRKIIEAITEKITVGKDEITIKLATPFPPSDPSTNPPPPPPSTPPTPKGPVFSNATLSLRPLR